MTVERLPNAWQVLPSGLRLSLARWRFTASESDKEFSPALLQRIESVLVPRELHSGHSNIPRALLLLAIKLQSRQSDEAFGWYLKHAFFNEYQEFGYPYFDAVLAHQAMVHAVDYLRNISELVHVRPQDELTESRIAQVFDKVSRPIQSFAPYTSVQKLLILALERGIPVRRHSGLPSYQLGYGSQRKIVRNGYSGKTSQVGTVIATHKYIAAQLLRENAFPVPGHMLVSSLDQAVAAAERLSYPVVVKPASTDKGIGITVDVETLDELKFAYANAAQYGQVLVEEMVPGFDHRLHVIDGKCIYAVRRFPPFVVGNGKDTIARLVADYASKRASDPVYQRFASASVTEAPVLHTLAKQGLSAETIPESGRKVFLKTNSNVSTGGTKEDVTSEVHPDNLFLAERVARCVGLDNAGIDFITEDISKSWIESSGKICEVNPTPGFSLDIAYPAFLSYLFPGSEKGKIPILLLVGSRAELEPYLRAASDALDKRYESWGRIVDEELEIRSKGRSYRSGKSGLHALLHSLLSDETVKASLIHTDFSALKNLELDIAYCDLLVFCGSPIDIDSIVGDDRLNLASKEKTLVNPSLEECVGAVRSIFDCLK